MAPGATVEMDMKQAVMEEAAQVNKKDAVGLTHGFLNGSSMTVRCREPVVGCRLRSGSHAGRLTVLVIMDELLCSQASFSGVHQGMSMNLWDQTEGKSPTP